jgi:hypothetical protein
VSEGRDPAQRIRTLLLRGDNVLKHGGDRVRALEAFEEAQQVATEDSVDPRLRDLVARRIASVQQLFGE